jgi:hypothetical protein
MKHLQNQTKKPKQSDEITPIFEPRCQHERFGFAAGGFMMYRRRNSAGWTRRNRTAGRLRSGRTRAMMRQWTVRRVAAASIAGYACPWVTL